MSSVSTGRLARLLARPLSGTTGCQLLEAECSTADAGGLRIGSVALLDDPGAESCTPGAVELGEAVVDLRAVG